MTRFVAVFGVLALSTTAFAQAAPAAEAAPAVQASDGATRVVMDNGLVGLTIDKTTGFVTSLRAWVDGRDVELGGGPRTMYLDYNDRQGTRVSDVHPFQRDLIRLVDRSDDAAEAMIGSDPRSDFPFHVELHLLLRRGDSGFYVYVVYRHAPGMPAVRFVQTRTVVRGVSGGGVFTHYCVDDRRKGPYPAGRVVQTVQDTTWKYEDGTVHSKYDYSAFIKDDVVFGMAGHGIGLWIVQPSREYVNGGPLRQELTVHQSPDPKGGPQQNIMQWMVQGEHFGGPEIALEANQTWSRFYGPSMVYVNRGPSVDALWEDAKRKAREEVAKWPYAFVRDPDYPLERGTVSGRVTLADGRSTAGAWVVLAYPGDADWCMSSHGYEFWTKADADGRFHIANVRPGKYALFVSGGDQFEDLRHDNVEVTANHDTDLGLLEWQPITHGRRLWQIGTADRSSREFKGGDDVRHYDNFIRYATAFPNDVTFTVGKCRENEDWNFAQWGWYVKKPYWSILFDQAQPPHGKATLTLGFVGWEYRRPLTVQVNGHEVGSVSLRQSGAAVYRSGGKDSLYQVAYVPFDAGLLHGGTNEIRLSLTRAVPFANPEDARPGTIGGVLYDAVRLEVDPTAAP